MTPPFARTPPPSGVRRSGFSCLRGSPSDRRNIHVYHLLIRRQAEREAGSRLLRVRLLGPDVSGSGGDERSSERGSERVSDARSARSDERRATEFRAPDGASIPLPPVAASEDATAGGRRTAGANTCVRAPRNGDVRVYLGRPPRPRAPDLARHLQATATRMRRSDPSRVAHRFSLTHWIALSLDHALAPSPSLSTWRVRRSALPLVAADLPPTGTTA